MRRSPSRLLVASLVLSLGTLAAAPASAQIGTTAADFTQPGSQPGDLSAPIVTYNACNFCHGFYDERQEPYERWTATMMANAMRDPMFQAGLTIANQDMSDSGELCLRCHTPIGFITGDSSPADGSALTQLDYEGVNCNFCHRLVDPHGAVENPAEDPSILAALANAPDDSHGGQFVLDPEDRRRGPFDLGVFFYHDYRESPYHREALLCATCHEVSNPAFTRSGGATPSASDTYVLNTLASEHPTHAKTDEYALDRTFTEWALSDFGAGEVEMNGRFGGNQTAVSTCQDCHMPTTTGTACLPFLEGAVRTDLPQHDFNGANSWVPRAIFSLDQSNDLYVDDFDNGQPLSVFEAAIARNKAMLRKASDLDLSRVGNDLVVRITNQTGHKLPTGFSEGRRMWIHVEFRGVNGVLLAEHGHYDATTATLTTNDTKVYEVRHGLDAAMATATGLPAAASFHNALNNKLYKDNRIPPRGFDNAAFEAGQAQPVGASYADGQYWDDTTFPIPSGATSATVSIYHQTTSKEYVEFLRDENATDGKGDVAYDEWVAAGKSKPVLMDRRTFSFLSPKIQPKKL
jgi:hypothetical protein